MAEFKGFDDWVEVFKSGRHTDGAGNTRLWTNDDLDKIVSEHNPSNHEAPIVIGHPVDNAPAWGWLSEVKRDGKFLKAKFKDVMPEFATMVSDGRFKKRSISLARDLRIKHIGWLGAVPPAVKGLKDMKFEGAEEDIIMEFGDINEDKTEGRKKMELEKVLTNFIEKITEVIGLAKKKDKDEEKKSDEKTDFSSSEEYKTMQAKAEASKTALEEKDKELAKFAETSRKAEHLAFCEKLKEDGNFPQAWLEGGIVNFLIGLDSEYDFVFSEGKKGTQIDWFKNFLSELPKMIEFNEILDKNESLPAGQDKFETLVEKMMKDEKIDFTEASLKVDKKHPGLYVA